jgi:hypothetical protein
MSKTFSNTGSEAGLFIDLVENGPDYDDGYSISVTTSGFSGIKDGIVKRDYDQQLIDLKVFIDDFIKSNKDQNTKILFAKYLEDLAIIIRKRV